MKKDGSSLLASAFVLESFWKKYKSVIIALVLIVIALGAYFFVTSWMKERQAKQSARLFDRVVKTQDASALSELKTINYNLYVLYTLSRKPLDLGVIEPLLESNKLDGFLKDYIAYQVATLKQDRASLGEINSGFSEFAALQRAYLLALKGDVLAARDILSTIPSHSPIKDVANLLSHYGVRVAK